MKHAQPTPLDAHVMVDARYIQERTSGIGRYTEQTLRALLAYDPSLRLTVVSHPSRPRPLGEDPRLTYQTLDAPPNSLRTRFLASALLDFDDIDLFHSPFNILPARLPVPSVFTLHDIMWLLDPAYCTDSWLRRLVTGTFYKYAIPASTAQAREIMTVSGHSRDAIESYFPDMRGHVHVTYNGLDPFFSPTPPDTLWPLISDFVPAHSRFVLVVGQGSPYKNHARALAGFLEAFGDEPGVRFVLVRRFARGPQHDLHELLRDPRLVGRVVHLEYVTGEQLRALYSGASAFLFPSLYEGFGLPILEAMACGSPVVTSSGGAMAEVAGDAAILVDPEDVGSIARGLRAAVEKGSAWREQGFERAASFTWEATARAVHQADHRAVEAS